MFTRILYAVLGSLAAMSANAGDASTLNILGFSEDGSVFAFEEYGVQDGSGFPYANRFYIDTASDSFLPGSPIRVRIDEDGADASDAREQARIQGEDIVGEAELAQHPGLTVAFSPFTHISADPHRVSVNPRPVIPAIDDPLELRLEELQFPATGTCDGIIETRAGFRLLRIGTVPGQATTLLHEDASVPASRGCTLGYRIGGIQTFHPSAGDPLFVVLIQVRSFGFEGPDHRWIAIPGRL